MILLEGTGEIFHIGKTGRRCDLVQWHVGRQKKLLRKLHTFSCDVLVYGDTEFASEMLGNGDRTAVKVLCNLRKRQLS